MLILLICLSWRELFAQVAPTNIVPVTPTSIGKYEKFELGVALNTTNFSNQFDPNEIEVYAIFKFTASGAEYRINAFWFQDYNRNENTPDPTNNNPCDINAVGIADPAYLTTIATPLPWRIRFAPNAVGPWTYRVYVRHAGQTVASAPFNMTCNTSNKNGYIGVGSNKTHFVYTNTGNPRVESGFLPLGVNTMDKGSIVFNRAAFQYTRGIMEKLASVNGNTIRLFMSPEQFGIEWKEDGLGRYATRQNRAFNLDEIFRLAEELGIKVQLVVVSNHEFHNQADGAQAGYNFWNNNPYRQFISSQYDFFTNGQCFDYFKRRMRYVIARWGYSPSLLAYEMWNEVDIMVGASPAFWDNNNTQKVKDWHNNIINYAKTMDKNHMYTTSTGFTVCGTAVGTDNIPFFNSASLDYVQDHYYSNDMNVPFNYAVFAQHSTKKYDKPYITGEIGSQGCWFGSENFTHNNFTGGNYAHDMTEFHNAIWSSLFNSSAGPAYSWDSKNLFNGCWGGPYKAFKPMAAFLDGDDFFTKELTYLTNKPAGNAGPKDDPNHNLGNNSLPFWSYPNYSSPSQLLSYLNYGITTSNDEMIDVFAAKSTEGRIQGWVHHRKNYWYELPHSSGDIAVPMCNDFNDNQPSTPANVPTLTRESFTINNVACDGMYKVDFYSTYPEYDVNGDNVNENGGVIAPLSQSWLQAYCGTLTIPIPDLSPLQANGGSLNAPDYAFKVSKIQDYWSHSLVIGGVTQMNRMSNNASTKTFYSDNNGAIRTVIFDNASNTFQHELISPYTPPVNDRSYSAICANNDDLVFYRGADSKLQCYYLDNSIWNHIWMTDWNSNSQDIAGNIAFANGNVYYQGVDNKIHRFKYVGVPTWQHSILPNPTNDPNMNLNGGSITVNAIGTQVYYKGADNRLQCYYLDNFGNWLHVWMTDWANTSQNVAGDMKAVADGIYYAGTDGYLHRYHFNNSTSIWEHDLIRNGNNQPVAIPANTDISLVGNADQIFFRGTDNNMQHLYAKNGNNYFQDLVICYNDLNSSYQPNGRIVSQSDGATFYVGLNDNFIHMYAFDSGCNPREEKTGKRSANTSPSRFNFFDATPASTVVPMIEKIEDGREKYDASALIQIFPNPVEATLQIKSKTLIFTVKMFDIYGRNVYSTDNPSSNHDINTAQLPSGIYMVSILKDGIIVKTEKVIKK